MYLLCFQAVSNFKSNLAKSKIERLSGGVNTGRSTQLLGCKVVKLLIKYLGIAIMSEIQRCENVEPNCG